MPTNLPETIDKISGRLAQSGLFSEIDIHFARFVTGLAGSAGREVFAGALLASKSAAEGHVCTDLSQMAEKILVEKQNGLDAIVNPSLPRWREKMLNSNVVGAPGEYYPLILDEKNRLYLYRYWNDEQTLVRAIKYWSKSAIRDIDWARLKLSIEKLFPQKDGAESDLQPVAALAAVIKRFCVIAGGPGTGKTSLVSRILALLLEQHENDLDIYLAAPTGKAAAKLKETICKVKDQIRCDPDIKAAIPTETYTIHRLLGSISGSPCFRYNRENRLKTDVVVVDEVSMVDMALMARLVEALPLHARLILVGDTDQLASVDAGSVLGDICDRDRMRGYSASFCRTAREMLGDRFKHTTCDCAPAPGLQDCIVVLDKSYRFPDAGKIGEFSREVNNDNVSAALKILKRAGGKGLSWLDTLSAEQFFFDLEKKVLKGYGPFLETVDPSEALKKLENFMILCATRKGLFGVENLNAFVETTLRRTGLIPKTTLQSNQWYPGRPVLITRNNYELGLFNGDIGVTLPVKDSPDGRLHVFFPGPDGNIRKFSPDRLFDHETAFAMTIHKSQGSEFEHVLLVLPNRESPLLTKELIYTGITRARKSVSLWSSEKIVRSAISKKIERSSGLRDAIWA